MSRLQHQNNRYYNRNLLSTNLKFDPTIYVGEYCSRVTIKFVVRSLFEKELLLQIDLLEREVRHLRSWNDELAKSAPFFGNSQQVLPVLKKELVLSHVKYRTY